MQTWKRSHGCSYRSKGLVGRISIIESAWRINEKPWLKHHVFSIDTCASNIFCISKWNVTTFWKWNMRYICKYFFINILNLQKWSKHFFFWNLIGRNLCYFLYFNQFYHSMKHLFITMNEIILYLAYYKKIIIYESTNFIFFLQRNFRRIQYINWLFNCLWKYKYCIYYYIIIQKVNIIFSKFSIIFNVSWIIFNNSNNSFYISRIISDLNLSAFSF